jgi:outer membrane protein OmpA-like peptidoglycan-associated protein
MELPKCKLAIKYLIIQEKRILTRTERLDRKLQTENGGISMRFNIGNSKIAALCFALCVTLLGSIAYSAPLKARQVESDKKSKIKGTIISRAGEVVNVKDKKSGSLVAVLLSDDTKIERKHGKVEFFRHSDMDVTAMVPGLTIEAEGIGNAKGQLAASKISFTPDEFAIEVAEEKQILANQGAASQAQSTANQGVAAANAAQNSANNAQASANRAGSAADAANAGVAMDAAAILMVNKRVSDLGDYKTIGEANIFFPVDGSTLDDAAKADLATVAAYTKGLEGYLVEIAGYASSTGSKQHNQQLSEARAAAVAQYLRETQNVPMRRIVVPAGYGSTHPDAPNSDPLGRAINRRVDVKVIVNKGLSEGT